MAQTSQYSSSAIELQRDIQINEIAYVLLSPGRVAASGIRSVGKFGSNKKAFFAKCKSAWYQVLTPIPAYTDFVTTFLFSISIRGCCGKMFFPINSGLVTLLFPNFQIQLYS